MTEKNILRVFLIITACLVPLNINSLTFNIEYSGKQNSQTGENTEFKEIKKLRFQANIEAGAKFEGQSSAFAGTKDFAALFIKPSFFINDFGIGFNFNFRAEGFLVNNRANAPFYPSFFAFFINRKMHVEI